MFRDTSNCSSVSLWMGKLLAWPIRAPALWCKEIVQSRLGTWREAGSHAHIVLLQSIPVLFWILWSWSSWIVGKFACGRHGVVHVRYLIVIEMGIMVGPKSVLHEDVSQWCPKMTGISSVALHQTRVVIECSLI